MRTANARRLAPFTRIHHTTAARRGTQAALLLGIALAHARFGRSTQRTTMRTFFGTGEHRKLLPAAALAVAIAAGGYAWKTAAAQGTQTFVSGGGYVERTEITVATRLAGRVESIFVQEGQPVRAGQLLARMQVQNLLAERDEAYARLRQAQYVAAAAEAELLFRKAETRAAEAAMRQRDGEFASVMQSLTETVTTAQQDASGERELEDHRAAARRAAAAASVADAQWATASIAVASARVQLASARSAITAAEATIRRVETELSDRDLKAPRDALVQYRFAQAGEALPAGGRVLNLVDMTDVNLTFLVPDAACRRVALGSEARIVLDRTRRPVIPATIWSTNSHGNSTCRVVAHVDRKSLQRHLDGLKTGVSGVGWVRLDPQAWWPPALRVS